MFSRFGSPGALSGVAGSLLLGFGAFLLRDLPSTGASDLDVYAYFLDHRDMVRVGAAACLGGLALLIPFFTWLRVGEPTGPRSSASMATLVSATLAIAAAIFAASVAGGLAVGADNADPGSSRTLLDLASALAAASGPLFGIALLSSAGAAHESGSPGWVPTLWAACGLACMLWLGPLLTDAAILQAGSILGTFAGIAGLVVFTISAALVAGRPDPRIALQ